MGRISKFRIKDRGRIGIAFILSMLLIIAVALTGCDSAASKENSNAKKHKQTEATSTDSKGDSESSDSSSSSSVGNGSDREKSKDKSKDKEKDKDKSKKNEKSSSSSSSSTSSSSSSSSSVAAKHKVWVPEQGHYEQKKVFKCRCGREFNSPAEQAAHRDEYIAEKRKTNPNFECKGDHLPKGWVTKQEWKVDVPGHYEYR